MPENKKQDNDWQRNANQPKKGAFTESHCVAPCLSVGKSLTDAGID
jgi:hypothetical protein